MYRLCKPCIDCKKSVQGFLYARLYRGKGRGNRELYHRKQSNSTSGGTPFWDIQVNGAQRLCGKAGGHQCQSGSRSTKNPGYQQIRTSYQRWPCHSGKISPAYWKISRKNKTSKSKHGKMIYIYGGLEYERKCKSLL